MKNPFSFIPLDAAVWDEMNTQRILPRLWQVDYTIWKPEPTEITNRLGWLNSPQVMTGMVPRIQALAEQINNEGYTQALLLGMGGSSLAPDLFRQVFPQQPSGLTLSVLDSTDPDAVLAQQKRIDPSRCLFIVSTKSGTTEETISFFKYFYNWVVDNLGADHASQHFIAITDPGSKLASLAQAFQFRAVFLNDPNIGGRYSALSCFGLLPAALAGVDISLLL